MALGVVEQVGQEAGQLVGGGLDQDAGLEV
jgi:hypothetical protein